VGPHHRDELSVFDEAGGSLFDPHHLDELFVFCEAGGSLVDPHHKERLPKLDEFPVFCEDITYNA